MTPRDAVLVLLPGLGADDRLFAAQRSRFPDLIVPTWVRPLAGDDLSSYAARIATQLPARRPLVVGGASFGGMLACELARILKPDALVLIGSARARSGIPSALRTLAAASSLLPTSVFGTLHVMGPAMTPLFGASTTVARAVFLDMLRATDRELVAWSCRAIARWSPPTLDGVRTYSIHGSADLILPARLTSVDELVTGAGHLLPVTHPERLNSFLQRVIDSVVVEEA